MRRGNPAIPPPRRMIGGNFLAAALLIAGLLFPLAACGKTIHTRSCSRMSVQSGIDVAASGDTVLVPGPCSASWSPAVKIPETRAITLASSRGVVSVAGATALLIEQNPYRSTRVTGFAFTSIGDSQNPTIRVSGRFSPPAAMARIDHNTFNSTGSGTWIETGGGAPVLIDHNSLSAGGSAEMIHNVAFGPERGMAAGWTSDVLPASSRMVFIEDNTFLCKDRKDLCNVVQSYYGARTVVRHNAAYFSQVDQHGTAGLPWARWWEIYDNTFFSMDRNQCCYMALRGGTGVAWGNSHPDYNDGGGGIGLFVEAQGCSGPYPSPGYPAPGQIGRGIDQTPSPAYFWANAPDMPVVEGPGKGCLGRGRDYFLSAQQPPLLERCESAADRKAGCPVLYRYTPFPYPYPLDAKGLPLKEPPAPPPPKRRRPGLAKARF